MNEPIEKVNFSNIPNISFINLQFVLEHLINPLEILQKAYQILSPGGIIRICVPNDFSESHLAYMDHFKEKPRWVCLPDHINYFNFDSLSKTLSKLGFTEVYRTTNFPVELLLLGGMNYYEDLREQQREQQRIGPIITSFQGSFINTGRKETLKKFYDSLAEVGFGRRVYMHAMKPL